MSAVMIMAVAVLMYVIHRWSENKNAVSLGSVIGGIFAIVVIALLDHGVTEPVAKGFAWLFFAVAAYNVIPNVAKATAAYAKKPKLGPPPTTA